MIEKATRRPKRGKEILKLVRDHAPITLDMIHRMLSGSMLKRNIRKALRVLRDKKLIEAVHADAHRTYYQISQSLQSRVVSSEILDCGKEEMEQKLLRRQDWFHNQWCEYWALSIKRQFPETEIIRESTIGGSELAKNVLQVSAEEFDLLPDLLIRFPSPDGNPSTFVAFEIERTRKSNRRILRKLKRYLNETKIDGLVYICDNGRLSETIRDLYRTRSVDRSNRTNHYAMNFFLFSDVLDGGGPDLVRLINANAEQVSFQNWCKHLRSTKWTKRRDDNFGQMGAYPFAKSAKSETA